jgi:hypothetical protein
MDGELTTFDLVQPTPRREWHLRRGDELVATLRLPVFRRGGRAELYGRRFAFRAEGVVRARHTIRDEATHEQLARVLPARGRQVVELGNRTGEWKRLARSAGHGVVGADGEPFFRGRVTSGLLRTNGELEVAPGLPDQEAGLLALLGAYLLIRKAEESPGVAGALTGAGA